MNNVISLIMLTGMLCLACFYCYKSTKENKNSKYTLMSAFIFIGTIAGMAIGVFSGFNVLEYLYTKNIKLSKGSGLAFVVIWATTLSALSGIIASTIYGRFKQKKKSR